MAEKKQNPAVEPLQKGAQAANMVRGAVKTGKAVAPAAKGAAAGGPYGAIIAFAWQNRDMIVKITMLSLSGSCFYVLLLLCYVDVYSCNIED